MSFKNYTFQELVEIFTEERILNRATDIKKFLSDFSEQKEFVQGSFQMGYPIDELAMALCLEGFNLFANFTKPFLKEEHFSNKYKVASNLIFTVLMFDGLFVADKEVAEIDIRKQRVAFALYVATMVLSLQDSSHQNWFNRYLNTNSGIVSDDFDTLQEHFIYYLTHLNISDLLQYPVVLLSIFLHSFTMWWRFDGDTRKFPEHQL